MAVRVHEGGEEAAGVEARRRAGGKPAGRRGGKASGRKDAPKAKVNLAISARAFELLGVYALKTGASRGDVVTDLIETHLKRYQVRDLEREKPGDPEMEDRQAETAA